MTESQANGAAAFSGLVAGIAAAAGGMLQQVGSLIDGNPVAGGPAADDADPEAGSPERQADSIRTGLANARHYIDTLVMLQQKTKGNLTLEEEQLLNTVLTDLRMTFVRLNDRWSSARSG